MSESDVWTKIRTIELDILKKKAELWSKFKDEAITEKMVKKLLDELPSCGEALDTKWLETELEKILKVKK